MSPASEMGVRERRAPVLAYPSQHTRDPCVAGSQSATTQHVHHAMMMVHAVWKWGPNHGDRRKVTDWNETPPFTFHSVCAWLVRTRQRTWRITDRRDYAVGRAWSPPLPDHTPFRLELVLRQACCKFRARPRVRIRIRVTSCGS